MAEPRAERILLACCHDRYGRSAPANASFFMTALQQHLLTHLLFDRTRRPCITYMTGEGSLSSTKLASPCLRSSLRVIPLCKPKLPECAPTGNLVVVKSLHTLTPQPPELPQLLPASGRFAAASKSNAFSPQSSCTLLLQRERVVCIY